MATSNPIYRDTADRFNDENYEQPYQGVSNVTISRGNRPATFAANSNRAPSGRRSRYAPLPLNPDFDNSFDYSNSVASSQPPQPIQKKPRGKLRQTIEAGQNAVAKVGSKAVSIFLDIFMGFCAPVQLVLGGIASVAFFIGAGLYSIADEAAFTNAVLGYAGMTPENFLLIYFGGSVLVLVLNFIQLILGGILFKIAQSHPIGGRGSTSKIATLMLIVIASFVPLLQLIPLVWLWTLAVALNPR